MNAKQYKSKLNQHIQDTEQQIPKRTINTKATNTKESKWNANSKSYRVRSNYVQS